MEEYLVWLIALAVLVYWLSPPFFCAWLAEEKGRSVYGWFVLGLLFSLIALLTIVGAPVLEEEEEPEPPRRGVRRLQPR